jgi:hypothetical protein
MSLTDNDQQEINHTGQGLMHTCFARLALRLEAKGALGIARKIHLKADFAVYQDLQPLRHLHQSDCVMRLHKRHDRGD